jgi:hypothetical protein
MNGIPELQECYFMAHTGLGSATACIDWAIARLQNDEEGDDADVVLLAGTDDLNEAIKLSGKILARYTGPTAVDPECVAGKYIASLHPKYLQGEISVVRLDEIIGALYYKLDYPDWLVMLSRNCEYATDMPEFEKPFQVEFQYLSELWSRASSLQDFLQIYDRRTSDTHDWHSA